MLYKMNGNHNTHSNNNGTSNNNGNNNINDNDKRNGQGLAVLAAALPAGRRAGPVDYTIL